MSKKPVSNGFRNKLTSASTSVGDEDSIDDTTIAVVLETIFATAVSDWCDNNYSKLQYSPLFRELLTQVKGEHDMDEDCTRKKTKFS
jgi:hypothetical protein